MNNTDKTKAGDKTYEGIHTMRAGSEQKLLGLLGFAARARKLVCGTDQCRDEIRRGRLPNRQVSGK